MSASSVTSKSTTAAAIADDTTNTPYNPDKQQRPRSPSASNIVWKRSKTGDSLLTPLSTEATMALSDPPPPLVDGLPAPDPPVPPPAPRYCTRQTVKQMQATADAVTKQELTKLQQGGTLSMLAPPPLPTRSTAGEQNGFVQMMAHVNQTMVHVNQLMDDNAGLRRELKRSEKELTEKSDMLEHVQGISDSYEEDIQVLTEERDASREERDEGLFAVAEAEATTRAVRASIPSWCLLICAVVVLVGLHLNYEYNLDFQGRYANTVRTLQANYWVWVTMCFVEEGDAAGWAQARSAGAVTGGEGDGAEWEGVIGGATRPRGGERREGASGICPTDVSLYKRIVII